MAAGFVAVFGVAIAALGLWGLAAPRGFVERMLRLEPWRRLELAVGLRIVLGIALVLAAPASRHPDALRILGIVAIVAGVAVIPIGAARIEALARWWLERPALLIRAWAVAALALGGFLLYAVC